MSGRFLFPKNTVGTPKAITDPPNGHRIDIIDQYKFTPGALSDTQALLLGQHLDEHHLQGMHPALDAFLIEGGGIAIMGPVALPPITFLSPHRIAGHGHRDDWILEMAHDHPVMEGVAVDDLTFRKGVVGFWARGTITPHENAQVLTRFATTGAAADWVWESGKGGKLFVHPGNDVWGYASEPNSSARVFPQLLDWLAA